MSTRNSPQDDADLQAFLARQSPVSTDYDNLELVEPPAELDARILAAARATARAAATPVATPAPASDAPDGPPSPTVWIPPPRQPEPDTDDDDDEDVAPPAPRPRWMVPVALAASALVAVGIGFAVLDTSPSVKEGKSALGAIFAKRARERSEAEKAAAIAAAEKDVEVMVFDAPPPPPPAFFDVDSPQIADLRVAIAQIRRELLRVEQQEASEDEQSPGARSESTAEIAVADAPIAPAGVASIIQPRNRRLAKIIELYDGGNPDLAEDALAIFLRDFADDPISQRILGVKP